MPRFSYVAKTREGKKIKGEVEVDSLLELYDFLESQNLFLVEDPKLVSTGDPYSNLSPLRLLLFRRGISKKNVITALKTLGTLIKSGISLSVALEETARSIYKRDKRLSQILTSIKDHISRGARFSEACANYPEVFDPVFIESMKFGELSGQLDRLMDIQIRRLEEEYQLRKTLKQQSAYPLFIITMVFILLSLMIFVFIPKITNMYKELVGGVVLPRRTAMLMSINNFLVHYGWILPLITVLIASFFIVGKYHPMIKPIRDKIVYKLPIIGQVVKSYNLTYLSLIISVGVESGISIRECLSIARSVLPNWVFKQIVLQAEQLVEQGSTLSQSFNPEETDFIFVTLLRSGELSGSIDRTMRTAYEYYTSLTSEYYRLIISVLGYLAILILGLIVGYTVLSVVVPIYELPSVIS